MTATLDQQALVPESDAGLPPLPTATRHISPARAFANCLTMAYRGIITIRHNPWRLADVTLQPVVFILMFTYLFGGAMMGSVAAYLPWIIPGVMVQTVVGSSATTGVQLREDMNNGVFDRFKSLPISRIAPLAGALMADMVRYSVASTMAVLTGVLIGYRPGGGFSGVLAAAGTIVVCSFALSWIFALLGVMLKSTPVVQGLTALVMGPLTFCSSAFAMPFTMPHWMQVIVHWNPVTHLVNCTRDLMNNGHLGREWGYTMIGAACVVTVFAPLAVRMYMRKT